MARDQAERQANICRVFSNPSRILIIWALAGEELSVSELSHAIGSSVSNTSYHLRLMKDSGILHAQRDGQTIRYQIGEHAFVRYLLDQISDP